MAWPASPEAASKNMLGAAQAESEPEASESHSSSSDHGPVRGSVRARVAAAQLRLKKKCGKKGRRGAPMSSASTVHRPGNVSLSRKAFNRVVKARDPLEVLLKEANAKLLRYDHSRVAVASSKSRKVAIVALLQAFGVSASNVPPV